MARKVIVGGKIFLEKGNRKVIVGGKIFKSTIVTAVIPEIVVPEEQRSYRKSGRFL